MAAALFHDAYDHKYVGMDKIEFVKNKIKKKIMEIGFTDTDC